jgi:photosystem II stability/assembly factor-like uncharacterized protein
VTEPPIAQFKLLTSDSGWPSTGTQLFWTNNNGNTWSNISPPNNFGDKYADVTFVTNRIGWVLFVHHEQGPTDSLPNAASGDWTYYVASTRDGGETWSTLFIPAMQESPGDDLTDVGYIAFAGERDGWIEVHHSDTWGSLLRTVDGGATWHWVTPAPSLAGQIASPSPNELYIAGNHLRYGSQLYATHDGGQSFQLIQLQAPQEVGGATVPTYALPRFTASHVYEPVTFSGSSGVNSAAVLFSSEDGGHTWHSDRILSALAPSWMGHHISSDVVGTAWITPFGPAGHQPKLMNLTPSGRSIAQTNAVGDFSRCALSFASTDNGWVQCSGPLMSTTDAGATWRDIGPRLRGSTLTSDPVTPVEQRTVPMHAKPYSGRNNGAIMTPATHSSLPSGIGEKLGIDAKYVPTTDVRKTWWSQLDPATVNESHSERVNDFVATVRVSKLNLRRPAPRPGSPYSERVNDFVATVRVSKLNLRRPAPRPGSPYSKKLKPLSSHLSVMCFAAPAQRYLLSTRFGKNIIPGMKRPTRSFAFSLSFFSRAAHREPSTRLQPLRIPFSELFSELQKQNTKSVRGH